MLNQIIKGYKENNFTYYYLKEQKTKQFIQAFNDSEYILICFPLYVHAMPSIVKDFIESIPDKEYSQKNIGFLIQSGFPEAGQSRWVESYLIKLVKKLGSKYLGTLIHGNSETIRLKPSFLNRKLFYELQSFGNFFARTGEFDKSIIERLAKPEKLGPIRRIIYRFTYIYMSNIFFWNIYLIINRAFRKRHVRPYE